MRTKPPTLRDKLSLEHVISPPRKKSRTTFGSLVNDLEANEEWTCSNEIKSKGGEDFDAIVMQCNIEEKLESNLN